MRDVGGEREQRLGLVRQRRRALVRGAAFVDAALEVEEATRLRVEDRVARRRALHARARIGMTARAGSSAGAGRFAPQALAALDPQHPRVGELVLLERPLVGGEEREARLQPVRRDRALLRHSANGERQRRGADRAPGPHPATVIGWRAVSWTPASSVQKNSSSPLASATV